MEDSGNQINDSNIQAFMFQNQSQSEIEKQSETEENMLSMDQIKFDNNEVHATKTR